MVKPLIDTEALVAQFESATAQQGEQVRKAVAGATLQALQARELTLKNIKGALKSVTEAVGAGLAKNPMTAKLGQAADAEALLDKAVAGMDDALLKAVEANRVALERLVQQGADLREKTLGKAVADLEKFEDSFITSVRKAAGDAGGQLGAMWSPVLQKMQMSGTAAGGHANATAEKLMDDMQTAVRSSRAAGLRAAQAMAESYTAMVSGVLLGMSEALQQGGKTSGSKKR